MKGKGRGRRNLKKLRRPPKTKRYCLVCKKMTTWKYSPYRLHSNCLECGGSYSRESKEVKK